MNDPTPPTAVVRSPGGSLVRRALTLFLLVDVAFELLIFPAYFQAVGTTPRPQGISAALLAIIIVVPAFLLWLLSIRLLAAPFTGIDALASSATSDDDLSRTSVALERFPRRMALLWSLKWTLVFGLFSYLAGEPHARPAQVSFLLAMILGPLPLAHSLSVWLGRREAHLLSRALLDRGHGLAGFRHKSLRGRLVIYGLCLALAPSFYIGALALAPPRQDALSLGTLMVIFSGAIALFGILCALLLSLTFTEPLNLVGQALRGIARTGSARAMERLPVARLDELGRLVVATNQMLDRLEATEVARDKATDSLAALNRTLERQVGERTRGLSAANHLLGQSTQHQAALNRDMRLVLDNVADGFLCVDRAGTLIGHRSRQADTWFGGPAPGATLWSYLGAEDRAFAEQLEAMWSVVVDDFLPLEMALDQCPRRLRGGQRTFRVEYRSVQQGAMVSQIVVVVRDITNEIQIEQAEVTHRELATVLGHMVRDRAGVVQFMAEGDRIVHELRHEVPNARLLIHTLKGNAALFGLRSVADVCDRIEGEMEESRQTATAEQRACVRDTFETFAQQARPIVGSTSDALDVTVADLEELRAAMRAGVSSSELDRRVAELRHEPVRRTLARAAVQARELAHRLGKGAIDTTVSSDDIRCSSVQWGEFWAALVHAVRNAVDHGLEDPGERLSLGKPENGRLSFSARVDGDRLRVAVADDGRGVAWEKVAARARAAGLPADTEADLIAALFADGLSTTLRANEISGRGVGLAALRRAAQKLGGELFLRSTRGGGTTLVAEFPLSARDGKAEQRGVTVSREVRGTTVS